MRRKMLLLNIVCVASLVGSAASAQFGPQVSPRWRQLGEALARPITVTANNVRLGQISTLLGASGVSVRVAPEVNKQLQMDLNVRDVPLHTVLAMIARPLDLALAPDAEAGVIFKNWPQATINGQAETFRDPAAPWTKEWPAVVLRSLIGPGGLPIGGEPGQFGGGSPGSVRGGFERGGPAGSGYPLPPFLHPDRPNLPGDVRYVVPQGPWPGLMQPAFTAVGEDRLLVTEATQDGRQPGWRMTMYIAGRDGLRRGSSLFHAAAETEMRPPPPRLGSAAPAAPASVGFSDVCVSEPQPEDPGGDPAPARQSPRPASAPGPGGVAALQGAAPRPPPAPPARLRAAPYGGERFGAPSLMLYPVSSPDRMDLIPLGKAWVVAVEPVSTGGQPGWRLTLFQIQGDDMAPAGSLSHEAAPPRPYAGPVRQLGRPEQIPPPRRPGPPGAPRGGRPAGGGVAPRGVPPGPSPDR